MSSASTRQAVESPLVLIVDDSEDGRIICAEYLEFHGFRVALAQDGQQALDFVGDEVPDLIVMDLGMPVLGGIEAARRLRSAARTAGIPLIALTAYTSRDTRAEAMAAGFDLVLTKPCQPAALESEIRRILSA
jgi:two-component system cell cycle response regulator DivK